MGMVAARLQRLTPATQQSDVVRDMFSGAAHTLPPCTDIFEQFMTYFVDKYEEEGEEKGRDVTMNENVEKVEKGQDVDVEMECGAVSAGESESEDEEVDLDADEIESLKKIINAESEVDLSAWKETETEVNGKKKKKGKGKKKKEKEMVSVDAIMSSFWSLRDGLSL